MFHTMWNGTIFGTTLLDQPPPDSELLTIVSRLLRTSLPGSWRVDEAPSAGRRPDGALTITAPDGSAALIAVETKRRLDPKDVPQLLAQRNRDETAAQLLVAAPFL